MLWAQELVELAAEVYTPLNAQICIDMMHLKSCKKST